MNIRVCVIALVTMTALVGCQQTPVGPGPLTSSWLTATVQGSTLEGPLSAEYAGSGQFLTTPNARRPAAPALFLLKSQGAGAAQDDGFELWKSGSAIPDAGSYSLGPQLATDTFAMVFTQRRGNVTYRYGAQSGDLHIHSASPERLTGTFTFTGVFTGTCTTSGGAGRCDPAAPAADAPTLTVSGSFDAVRTD